MSTASGVLNFLMRGTEPVRDAIRRKYGSLVGGIYRVSTYTGLVAGEATARSVSGIQCSDFYGAVHVQVPSDFVNYTAQALSADGKLYISNTNEYYGHGCKDTAYTIQPTDHFWEATNISDVLDFRKNSRTNTVFFRKPDLTVWFFGPNVQKEGGNTEAYSETAIPIGTSGMFNNVDIVDYDTGEAGSGGAFGVFVDSKGRLWGAGNCLGGIGGASYGVSGTTYQQFCPPVQVSGFTDNAITKVCCGDSCSFVVDASGYVYSTGKNYSNLGFEDGNPRFAYEKISGISGIVDVFSGIGTTYALDIDGYVWSWGTDANGELGRSGNRYLPGKITTISGIVDVIPGTHHAFAKDNLGRFYSWGINTYGQLCRGYVSSSANRTPMLISGSVLPFKTSFNPISMAPSEFVTYFIAPTQIINLYIKGHIGTPENPWASGICKESKCILYHPADDEYEFTTATNIPASRTGSYVYPPYNLSPVNGNKMFCFKGAAGNSVASGVVPSCISLSGSTKNTYTFWSSMSSGVAADKQEIKLHWMNNDNLETSSLNGILLSNELSSSRNGRYNITFACSGKVTTPHTFDTLRPPATVSGVPTFYAITTELVGGKVIIGLSVNGSAFEYSPQKLTSSAGFFGVDNTVYPAFRFILSEAVAPKTGTNKLWLDEVAIWKNTNLKPSEVNNIYSLGLQNKALSDYQSMFGVTEEIPLYINAYGQLSGYMTLGLGAYSTISGSLKNFCHGHIVSSGFIENFIYGKPAYWGDLFIHGVSGTPDQPPIPTPSIGSVIGIDFKPQLVGDLGYMGTELVYVTIWSIKHGVPEEITLADNECYPIGNTGRWGWSTDELLPIAEHRVQYHYLMTVSGEEGGPYDFHGDFIIKAKGRFPHTWSEFADRYIQRSV